MNNLLSDRIQQVNPSPTLALSAKATALRKTGKDIINLAVGEPDFDTPQHIKEAAIRAIHENKTRYTPSDGTPSLKAAVAQKFKEDHNLDYGLKQIIVNCGAKHSLYNLFQTDVNPGQEVIIPAPYWVSYPAMVKLASGKPVIIPTTIEQQYKITAEQLEAAITRNTRAIVFNSPCNPSGSLYTPEELTALAEVLKQHPNILIVSDDIYEHITFTGAPICNILTVCPELYDRTILVNGVSKTYAMTGWRIGYAAGPQDFIQSMKKLQSQSTSNPCSIAQADAEAALTGDQTCVQTMRKAFQERRDFMFEHLQEIPDIKVLPSSGTFYIFPDFSAVINRLPHVKDDVEFADRLLNEANVSMVPGSAFGAPGSLRISFAASLESLKTAMQRLQDFCK